MLPLTQDRSTDTPRRQYLTLLFVDLCGSTHLGENMELEPFTALLGEIRRVVAAAVSRHGGRVVRAQGDGSLAVFGLKAASEHDARHACAAALEAHAVVSSWPALKLEEGPWTLALHSGMLFGLVTVSPGDSTRGDIDVEGPAANTASLLASVALPGEIVTNEATLGPERGFFMTRRVHDEGLARMTAVAVTGLSLVQRRIDGGSAAGPSPLLGREDVLARVLARCTGEDDRDLRVVEIAGAAGIGKTRLLDEVASRLEQRGWITMRGGCESYGIKPVLEPFRQMLAREDRATAPQDGAALHDAQQVRGRILSLLSERDGSHPVLLLDDWQWADDASRQLLEEVLTATRHLRVCLATREPDAQSTPWPRAALWLRPLSREETRCIVDILVPHTPVILVDELHEYAGGIPLHVEELCHMLRHRGEQGWRKLGHKRPRTGADHWMKLLMAARFSALDAQAMATLQAAAVAGLSAPRQQIHALLPGGLQDESVDHLVQADLLYPDGEHALRFRHGLSREAVYELIPLGTRHALHRKMVELIESAVSPSQQQDPVERLEALAHHSRQAEDWPQATSRCEAAADEATRLGAFDRARQQYLAALKAAEAAGVTTDAERTRWCTLVHRLGMACMFDPLALPESLPLVERCVQDARRLGNDDLLARSLYWEAYLRYVFGQPLLASRQASEARQLAAKVANARLVAQIDATLGQSLAALCRYPEAVATMQAALQAKQSNSQRSGSLAIGSAFTWACLGAVQGDRGDFVAAHACLQRAHGLVDGQPHHPVSNSVRNWEMIVLAWQCRWAEVLSTVQATNDLARRSKAFLPLTIAQAVEGYARWNRQHDPAAIRQTEMAVEALKKHRVLFFTSIYYGWLVEMAVASGQWDHARHWARRLLQRARAGERLGQATGWRALAEAARLQGDQRLAWRRLGWAESASARRGSARESALNALVRARLLRDESRTAEAERLETWALGQLQTMGLASEA